MPAVNVGRVLQNAAVFNFRRHRNREEFLNTANIPAEVEAFFDLLEARGVNYLLVGGLAMLSYLHGRNTEDVDLVISATDQQNLQPELAVTEREDFFTRACFGSLRVDLLAAEHPLFALVAREHADERRFDFFTRQRTIRSATPTGLMLLKLYALPSLYRQGQLDRAAIYEADIRTLLIAFPQIETENLLNILLQHGTLPSDVAELRKIISEQRPRQRF